MSAAKNILGLYSIATTVACAVLYSQLETKAVPAPTAKIDQCEARASAPQASNPVTQTPVRDLNISQALNQPPHKIPPSGEVVPGADLNQTAEEGLWNNILRYVSVSPEQRKKLLALQKAYAEIENSEMTPEEQEAKMSSLPTEEEILGEELSQQLREAQGKEEDVWRNENADRTLAYIEHAIGSKLGTEQREKALVALRAYDEYDPSTRADAEAAFLEQKLGLTKDQYEQVRQTVEKAQANTAVKDQMLNPGAEDLNQVPPPPNGDTQAEDQALAAQLAPILTEEQKKAYQAMLNQRHPQTQTFTPVSEGES